MRITRISVKKLFGTFNHTIDLNLNDRITIIHGPNGVGKTTLLKLVDALFNKQGDELRSVPFRELIISFDNGSDLSLKNNCPQLKESVLKKNSKDENQFLLSYKRKDQKPLDWPSDLRLDPREYRVPLSFIERVIPNLQRVGSTRWIDEKTGDILSLEKVMQLYGSSLPPEFRAITPNWPLWFDEYFEFISIRFIRAQRLLLVNKESESNRYHGSLIDDEKKLQVSDAVLNYSYHLKEIIHQKLAESSTLNQSLDRTFPQRLIENHKNEIIIQKDELLQRLTAVEEKRKFLIGVGLYDPEKEPVPNPEIGDEHIQSVLSVYVQDQEEKLSIYSELAGRIDLLENLINSRFLYKRMRIDKEKGFAFETDQGPLSPTKLSSGEQHELILIYELLFLTKKETLVFIDEPELSFHVGWQLRFLEDLQQIIEKTQINALIATHSPQIINNRWDLTVKLGGES